MTAGDDFLAELRRDWAGQLITPDEILRLVRRRRRSARWAQASSLVGAALLLAVGIAFVWAWVAEGAALDALSASAFLISVPAVLIGWVQLRRAEPDAADATPKGLLVETRRRAQTAMQLLWGARCAAAILLGCAVAAPALAAAGLAEWRTAAGVSAAWAVVAGLTWRLQAGSARRLAQEIAHCDRLLAEFEAE
ncbi:MAG: hypothetical protein ACAH11_13445 [Sphingomonas sp.]